MASVSALRTQQEQEITNVVRTFLYSVNDLWQPVDVEMQAELAERSACLPFTSRPLHTICLVLEEL